MNQNDYIPRQALIDDIKDFHKDHEAMDTYIKLSTYEYLLPIIKDLICFIGTEEKLTYDLSFMYDNMVLVLVSVLKEIDIFKEITINKDNYLIIKSKEN